jgi:hypothetical protein
METGVRLNRATGPIEKMGEVALLFFFPVFHFPRFLIAFTHRLLGIRAQSELSSRFSAVSAKIFDLMLNGQDVVTPSQIMDPTTHVVGQEQTSSRATNALGKQSNGT